MKKNPFKFGSIVDGEHFTDRNNEIEYVKSVLSSENHLIIMSPRRYGKSSLIHKALGEINRPTVSLDLQLVTGTSDLAAQLLKRIYRLFPFERLKQYIQNFRVIPSVSVNPVTNAVDISFHPESASLPVLEDVLNLFEQVSSEAHKLIVVFDEFQEVTNIDKNLLSQMRSVMQYHKLVNYVFLGSQESLIEEIFQKKKSPFYHFGLVFKLDKIPETDFQSYLDENFAELISEPESISTKILEITNCHPYYTQQLAFMTWEVCARGNTSIASVEIAFSDLIKMHDIDYERLWNSMNKTDQKLLIGLAASSSAPMSEMFLRNYGLGATSTAFSSQKRLIKQGYIIKNRKTVEIDDPFFAAWINQRREA